MRRPKPREIPYVRTTPGVSRTRCTRTQPSKSRATRRIVRMSRLTGIQQGSEKLAPVQPLRSLRDWVRSIFDAAREMVDDSPELAET
jgi:hypothetical protein